MSDTKPIDGEELVGVTEDSVLKRMLADYKSQEKPKRGLRDGDIRVDRKLFEVVDSIDSALTTAGNSYQRAGLLVRIGTIPAGQANGVCRDEPSPGVISFDTPGLVDWCSKIATFTQWDGRKKDLKEVDPPSAAVRAMLSRRGMWSLPALAGFISAPSIRPDGSILDTPGFDCATGLFAHFRKGEFPPIPAHPSKDDAARALELLCEVFREFPYTIPAGRSVAVSAVLTALVRQSLPSAPMHIFTAPRPRSGKDKQLRCAALISTGALPVTVSQSEDEAEFQKRLLGILMDGAPVISINNVERPLHSESLCSIITEGTWASRILGSTNLTRVGTAVTLCASGNNLTLAGDLNERAIVSEIDPKCERPEERAFEQDDLEGEVRRRRHELAVAGITVIRAYLAAGTPDVGLKPWGGFEDWSVWVRSPLVWLGMTDPRESRVYLESRDPIRTGLSSLLSAWHEAVGSSGKTVAEMLELVTRREYSHASREEVWRYPALREAATELCSTPGGEFSARRLGIFIKAHQDRIEGGLRFQTSGSTRENVLRWYVVDVRKGVNS